MTFDQTRMEVEVFPDLYVGIVLPDGCHTAGRPGIETDEFVCRHIRRWVISTGEVRSVVTVLVTEVER